MDQTEFSAQQDSFVEFYLHLMIIRGRGIFRRLEGDKDGAPVTRVSALVKGS